MARSKFLDRHFSACIRQAFCRIHSVWVWNEVPTPQIEIFENLVLLMNHSAQYPRLRNPRNLSS